jgi:hypothetical protein
MVFSDVCYVSSLIRRKRASGLGSGLGNGLDYKQSYILPPIFETQFDSCLRFV